ncbi:hypothetical protein D3C81_2329130 [compost metagenome]
MLNPLYEFRETGETDGQVQGALISSGNPMLHTGKLRMAGITERGKCSDHVETEGAASAEYRETKV